MKRLLGAIAIVSCLATATRGLDEPPKPVSLFDGKTPDKHGWLEPVG